MSSFAFAAFGITVNRIFIVFWGSFELSVSFLLISQITFHLLVFSLFNGKIYSLLIKYLSEPPT